MSDSPSAEQISTICDHIISSHSNYGSQWLVPQLVGGALVLFGGIAVQVLRLRFEKKQEIEYIKVGLIDEITEIRATIGRMVETHRTMGNIPPTYFNELSENKESFNQHKPRLFLVGDTKLRKSICDFYKKMGETIKKSEESLGSLKDGEDQEAKINAVLTKFQTLEAEAQTLNSNVGKYRFKPLYII